MNDWPRMINPVSPMLMPNEKSPSPRKILCVSGRSASRSMTKKRRYQIPLRK
jgi:hypothetical protein